MDPVVQASLIAAVPASIAALGAWRASWKSSRTHKEVQTGNGMPLGPTVVTIKEELRALRNTVDAHRLDDNAHYRRDDQHHREARDG